jgi:hypothetical protein
MINIKELLQSTTQPMPKVTFFEVVKSKEIDKKEKVNINNLNKSK